MRLVWVRGMMFAALVLLAGSGAAQKNVVVIDATAPGEPVKPVAAKLGTQRNPKGETLEVNSQYLVLNGKPWLPVMGELHYSRVPEADWEAAILKMKAGGVNIISTYVIWIHHEQQRGSFDWRGNKDFRRFALLCAKHGMYLYPRIGPWAHAEVRNGGLPDWVAALPKTRENDPQYLREVKTFYEQIGQQMRGLYWKDGGPIVGLQLENEYRAVGPGKGADHLHTLKSMAEAEGMDVPLYTVTGWDGATIPLDIALPVFGGYPDAPWDSSPKALPPPEVYAFRFDNRSSGSMGALGGSGQSSAETYRGTPFFTAELGGGIQDTYFRRPVVSTDDIAAILPVMLGSGANLLGYYMFHGGRNPDGGDITLQESQRTGYPTDVPVKSYDFQAPISKNGEERESFRRLKLVHSFLNDFGGQLATMAVHRPAATPGNAEDLSTPRAAARTLGNSGFVFLNNYTRNGVMPDRPGFQVQLRLPSGVVKIPEEAAMVRSGAYGIWPVNLKLASVTLRYSTAQLFTTMEHGRDLYAFFFAIPGVVPEFLVDATGKQMQSSGFMRKQTPDGLRLRARGESGEILVQAGERSLHVILLPRSEAEDVWKIDNGSSLLLTKADFFADGAETTLEQEGKPVFDYGIFDPGQPGSARHLATVPKLFHAFHQAVPPATLQLRWEPVRKAGERPPAKLGPAVAWRKDPIVMAPEEKDFGDAGMWQITLSGDTRAPQLGNVLLKFRYQGDVARLVQDKRMLDDDFWNGSTWSVGLRQVGADASRPFAVQILPIVHSFPMFLQQAPTFRGADAAEQLGELQSVTATPVYRLRISDAHP